MTASPATWACRWPASKSTARAFARLGLHFRSELFADQAGFSVLGSSRADTERLLKSEAVRWAAVVKATGFKAE